MSCYYCTDRYRIVARMVMRDAAIKCLEDSSIYDCWASDRKMNVEVEELGNGLFSMIPDYSPFSGDWANSGPGDEIAEFLKTYCEPGSYVSQRCDDYFEYSIYWVNDERKVEEAWQGFQNPYCKFMDKLDEEVFE